MYTVISNECSIGKRSDRVAIVTGGAGAIGGAIATALRAAGHTVAVLDRGGDPPVDLAAQDDVRRAAARVLQAHGRCDVLVHAAAAFDRAALSELDLDTWRRVQAVNVESALWLSQALAPGMAQRRFGRIVFVVSDTVWDPPAPDLLAYVASKATLIGIARTLARGLGRDGITVNSVAPGLTPTPAAVADTPPEAFAAVRARQAIGRPLAPTMSPLPSRSSSRTPPVRSRGRRCAPTAGWFCVELGAVSDQVGAEPAVRVAAGPDLLQAHEVLGAEEPVRPAREVGVAEIHALSERRQPRRVVDDPAAVALVVGRVRPDRIRGDVRATLDRERHVGSGRLGAQPYQIEKECSVGSSDHSARRCGASSAARASVQVQSTA